MRSVCIIYLLAKIANTYVQLYTIYGIYQSQIYTTIVTNVTNSIVDVVLYYYNKQCLTYIVMVLEC